MNLFRVTVVALLALLAACDQQALFDKFVPKEEALISRQFLTSLAARDFAAVEQQLDPSLKSPDLRAKLEQVADQFPMNSPTEVQVVGANMLTTAQKSTYNLTFQYTYPSKWLLANVVLQRQGNQVTVAGVHVNPLSDSLQSVNRFTFQGKGIVHFIFVALAVAIPVFVLYALVACIRTPIARRKWLWVLFILVGLVQFSLNWTDGALIFNRSASSSSAPVLLERARSHRMS